MAFVGVDGKDHGHPTLRTGGPVSATFAYEIRRLRGQVELDGRDHEGIHLVAVADGDLVATCRLLMVGTTAQFSRLAVRTDHRRQGIATALLELAEAETRAAGGRRLVLHAQTYARELYQHAGYRPRGRLFWEAGIEHIAMEKQISLA